MLTLLTVALDSDDVDDEDTCKKAVTGGCNNSAYSHTRSRVCSSTYTTLRLFST